MIKKTEEKAVENQPRKREVRATHQDLNRSAEDIQKAKDYLWNYINVYNKEMLLLHAEMEEKEHGSCHVYGITLGYMYS